MMFMRHLPDQAVFFFLGFIKAGKVFGKTEEEIAQALEENFPVLTKEHIEILFEDEPRRTLN